MRHFIDLSHRRQRRVLCSLTLHSVEGQCCCHQGLKASSQEALDNHIQLRDKFYKIQHHWTNAQKPEEI